MAQNNTSSNLKNVNEAIREWFRPEYLTHLDSFPISSRKQHSLFLTTNELLVFKLKQLPLQLT